MRPEEEQLPDKLDLRIWARISKYALKRWDLILVIVLCMLFTSFYDASFVPAMNASAISLAGDSGLIAGASSVWELPFHVIFISNVFEVDITFLDFLIVELALVVIRSIAIFFTFYFTNYLSMVIMVGLREDLFTHVQELSFSYFDKTNSGWLIARMNNDTASIGEVLSWDIISIFWSLFQMVFTVITMFSQNVKYALIVIASLPLVAIIVPFFENLTLKKHRIARNAYSHYIGWLAEIINGAKTVKTLSIEDESALEAQSITKDLMKKRIVAGRVSAFFRPALSLISSIMVGVVVLVGYKDINALSSAGAEIATQVAIVILFASFVSEIYDPLQSVAEIFSDFMANQAGAEKVQQLLDAKVDIQDSKEIIEKYGDILHPIEKNYPPFDGDIEFKDVRFDYGNGVEVIHPLNLKIKKGTSLAIVGETGSGKTTMVNLLCRFYEPTSGQILLDGVDYKDRSLGWLRSNIGYVQQNPFVFSGTYAENIRYGKLDASQEEIEEAAKTVGIDAWIKKEKNGYDTFLKDGGLSLSQGQKQLISFARAIIRNPSILILDEATSSIDTETEVLVQNAIKPILKGRTSITIAHRLSTIVNSDRILVMDHGTIVEDGDHKSLMEKKGYYYKLYTNQFRDMAMDEQIEVYSEQIEGKGIKL